jgi:hypothetical protein
MCFRNYSEKHEPDCCISESLTPHVGESPKRGMLTELYAE